jgi:hypothetical protein
VRFDDSILYSFIFIFFVDFGFLEIVLHFFWFRWSQKYLRHHCFLNLKNLSLVCLYFDTFLFFERLLSRHLWRLQDKEVEDLKSADATDAEREAVRKIKKYQNRGRPD